ncbi:MAG: hypothetical protein APF84_14790 [Gracilibacter sp. BRH_c7a]|nr:MAG: hypothetical protein APF84_14790 [Gracilibacter sp. BRH_c7a]
MRQTPEQELDFMIDTLNKEQDPKMELHDNSAGMLAAVRAVRTLRKPAEPNSSFGQRIYKILKADSQRKRTPVRLAAIAAGVILVLALTFGKSFLNGDVVYAMEKAVLQLSSYQGTLEMSTENLAGEKWMVRKVEIWSEGEKYALRQTDGTLTVNNGEQKFQVRAKDQEIAILPLVPDYTKRGFDLHDEAEKAKQYSHTIVGQENIAGRETIKLKISPPGGEPYHLWIDAETDLPLQLQTAVQNALQTTYTFVSFEPNVQIDSQIFNLNVPEGFKVVEQDPGQLVNTISEASDISKFVPLVPQNSPLRIFVFKERIVLDYGDTTIIETPAQEPFKPAGYGAWGDVNGKPLEVIKERLRWQQQGLEIIVEGPQSLELARQIAPDLVLPDKDTEFSSQAKVKVSVDMEIVKADQKQVDGGHTPWQLDPLSVALTFVNLQVTPEGIVGEPEIPYSTFEIGNNNGVEAIINVAEGPISKVYLKRLVRQDESGIWSVIGYDPRL